MKAYTSTLQLIGALPGASAGKGPRLVALKPRSVRFSAVNRLSTRLGVPSALLLQLIGIPERTALRRKTSGFLPTHEADRLLRIARVVEEATRVFGSAGKARLWLTSETPMLGEVTPLSLLDSDAGRQQVEEELVRIDFGDFV